MAINDNRDILKRKGDAFWYNLENPNIPLAEQQLVTPANVLSGINSTGNNQYKNINPNMSLDQATMLANNNTSYDNQNKMFDYVNKNAQSTNTGVGMPVQDYLKQATMVNPNLTAEQLRTMIETNTERNNNLFKNPNISPNYSVSEARNTVGIDNSVNPLASLTAEQIKNQIDKNSPFSDAIFRGLNQADKLINNPNQNASVVQNQNIKMPIPYVQQNVNPNTEQYNQNINNTVDNINRNNAILNQNTPTGAIATARNNIGGNQNKPTLMEDYYSGKLYQQQQQNQGYGGQNPSFSQAQQDSLMYSAMERDRQAKRQMDLANEMIYKSAYAKTKSGQANYANLANMLLSSGGNMVNSADNISKGRNEFNQKVGIGNIDNKNRMLQEQAKYQMDLQKMFAEYGQKSQLGANQLDNMKVDMYKKALGGDVNAMNALGINKETGNILDKYKIQTLSTLPQEEQVKLLFNQKDNLGKNKIYTYDDQGRQTGETEVDSETYNRYINQGQTQNNQEQGQNILQREYDDAIKSKDIKRAKQIQDTAKSKGFNLT